MSFHNLTEKYMYMFKQELKRHLYFSSAFSYGKFLHSNNVTEYLFFTTLAKYHPLSNYIMQYELSNLIYILNLVIVAQTWKKRHWKGKADNTKRTSTETWIWCQNFVFLDQILTDHSTFWRICFNRILNCKCYKKVYTKK